MSYLNIPAAGSASWRNPVATVAELPPTDNTNGDAIVTQDTDTIYIWNGSAWVATGGGGGGSGTVTSVAMSVPSALLAVTGSPITTAGTLAVTLPTQTANKVFASPDGSTGTPSFRALAATDVPTLNQNTTGTAANVTGVVAIANGGTGQTTANAALNALLPSQTSNSGKVLQTDGTSTSWATVSADPLANIATTSTYFCDMDVTPVQYGFGVVASNGNGNFNTYPWTGDNTSIGVFSINTTAVNGWYFLTQVSNNTYGSQNIVNKQLTFVGRVALSVIPDASTANTINMVGFGNVNGSATTEHSNGIYFYASNASANWICKTARAGTRTSTDSGIALTTSMAKLSFIATTSQVLFYIDGVLAATHTTNIPNLVTQTMALQASIQSQATNYSGTRSIYLDYLGSQTVLTTGSR